MKKSLLLLSATFAMLFSEAQVPGKKRSTQPLVTEISPSAYDSNFKALKWRNIGPFRGGRSVTSTGVVNDPLTYYMGTCGGGVWKTTDGGGTWQNISDGYFKTGSVGAVAVSESDPNVVFVGMGEHAPRGVMTSYGDGVYKSTDAGKTWKKMGLDSTMQIANIRIHPTNPDIVFVAAEGAINGSNKQRGIYRTIDGGITWKHVLYADDNTGCADLSMDMNNPRILYAAMWEFRRTPWQIKSGGKGSGLYKSTDAGETWTKLQKGLPKELGKMAVSVSRANSDKVYALVESDTEKELGGLFMSDNAGKTWNRVSKDHRLVQRAWYYIEIATDPTNENVVYVFNSPGLKSIDGGKTWSNIHGTHGDYHQLWINPNNSKNMIISNDGGAAVTFNGGGTWSTQYNQPTAQIYRVNADNRFPYYVYGGQQDNSSVMILSRNLAGGNIGDKDWTFSAGGESAFLAFDPDQPRYVMGGSYQGTLEVLDQETKESKLVMEAPIQYQSLQPKDMKYRFNWNAPVIHSPSDPAVFYHAGNVVFKTSDRGMNWERVSPDLTRHDTAKMGISGAPYTNEGAGGENYCTISYMAEAANEKGVLWTGSDDGLVYLSRDGGKSWNNVTPTGLKETIINCIELSRFNKGTAYIATTRYKFNDLTPALYKTTDYGKTWTNMSNGIPYGAYTRCIREDDVDQKLLYAGTETGFYISYDAGAHWQHLQLNLPVTPITDLKVHKGNLIAGTMGRAFWILDDLNMLRQYNRIVMNNSLQLFRPADAYRVSGGSMLDASIDDEDAGPVILPGAGINAPTGVPIYYQVPSKPDSIKMTLEIMDESGKLVRKYSTQPDKKFVSFPGGPPEEPLLPNKAGLNRFVWDMRYTTLPGVPNVFIEGAYAGRKVAPGTFTVRVKTDKEEKTTKFNILPDPRISATQADYLQQQATLEEVDNKVKEIHEGVNRIRVARTQVNDLLDLLTDTIKYKPLIDSGRSLVKHITAWEEELVQPKALSNDDIINFINKLSADYIFLKGEMDVNIPGVTKGQREQLAALNSRWEPLRKRYQELISMVEGFNRLCSHMGIGKITLPTEQ